MRREKDCCHTWGLFFRRAVLVGMEIAAVAEEACGILSGDAVESGTERLLKDIERAGSDPAQV